MADALDILQRYDGRARVVGGGTDLLVELRRGLRDRSTPWSTSSGSPASIASTKTATISSSAAASRTRQIVSDERIIEHGTCLAESCGVIGGPQVRNVGTLAGNVAHALPAGDGTIGLLALGGEVEIAGTDGHALDSGARTRSSGRARASSIATGRF